MYESRVGDQYVVELIVEKDGNLVDVLFAETVIAHDCDGRALTESLPELLRRVADQIDEECGLFGDLQAASIFGARILRKA